MRPQVFCFCCLVGEASAALSDCKVAVGALAPLFVHLSPCDQHHSKLMWQLLLQVRGATPGGTETTASAAAVLIMGC